MHASLEVCEGGLSVGQSVYIYTVHAQWVGPVGRPEWGGFGGVQEPLRWGRHAVDWAAKRGAQGRSQTCKSWAHTQPKKMQMEQ